MLQKCRESPVKRKLTVITTTPDRIPDVPILEIRAMSKVFHVNGEFVNVLGDIHLSVQKGEFVCLMGRSGCGKTTLLNILAGFIPPSSGVAEIHGELICRPGPDRCVVFQEDALFPWLTVFENVAFGLRVLKKSRKKIRNEVMDMLAETGLNEFRDYLPGEISGGMKQRVALARVLILRPNVLLMDEPFAALDAQTREEMQKLLLQLWRSLSHTVVFVTHDVEEALTLADRILIMEKNPGRIRHEMDVSLERPRKKGETRRFLLSQKIHEYLSNQ